MTSLMLKMGTWQAGCWRCEHGRLDDEDGNMASGNLEMGT